VGRRGGLDDVEKRKFLTLPVLELQLLCHQPVASRYTDYAIPAPNYKHVHLVIYRNEVQKEISGRVNSRSVIFRFKNRSR
jgi:hypothetical protein